jgi:hypothetical protein
MLNKQVKIYSVDTKAFYNDKENKKYKQLKDTRTDLKIIEEYIKYAYLSGLDEVETIQLEDHLEKAKRFKHLKYMEEEKTSEEIVEMEELNEYLRDIRKVINSDRPRKNRNKEKDEEKGKKYDKLKKTEYHQFRNKHQLYQKLNSDKNEFKKEFDKIIHNNKNIKRELDEEYLKEYNQISIFDSALTRTLGIETNALSMDILVVRVYHYDIMYSLIHNGFTYSNENDENEKYIFFTASAGQIRQKKILMMKESVYEKFEKTFMCGLTKEDINKLGGINTNKFLSYLALNSSGTDEIITCVEEILEDEIELDKEDKATVAQEIKGFNIDRCIVIPDFETEVEGIVDYIEKKEVDKEFNVKYYDVEEDKNKSKKEIRKILELQDNIERKKMKIKIEHSDGCGWTIKGKTNHMIRLPWIKGLMAKNGKVFDFCDKYNGRSYKLTDIYGKEWDLKEDKIEYVFTKSQFKLWKYYPNDYDENGNVIKYGWDKYKEAFKSNNCKANMCNPEPTRKKDFRQSKFNYQMWQTLIDITDDEIKQFTDSAKEYLKSIYTDKSIMLKELKADDSNKRKNYFQQALSIYPELLKDPHCKSELSNKISSKKDEYKAGRFEMNAHHTFIIPDLFAWMQNVFFNERKFNVMLKKKKIGLLNDGEVSCKLFQANELIVNRSPHLYREYGIRDNINNKSTNIWLKTNAIYVSCYDLLSKLLMFDCDGDTALVIDEPDRLLPIVKRNIGYDLPYKNENNEWNMEKIVPLYYEMGVAKGQELKADNFYKSLISAFTSSNIGKFSNQLTKLWSRTKKGDDLTVHKLICALNNYAIDSAKTLQSAYAVEKINNIIKELEKEKLPYFFQFAKDKEEIQTNEIGEGTVDRITKEIETLNKQKFDFSSVGKFSYKELMRNHKIEINDKITQVYKKMNEEKDSCFKKADDKQEIASSIYSNIKEEFLNVCQNENIQYEDVVDMVVKYVYREEKNYRKSILFNAFGDVIVNNLENNIKKQLSDGYIQCSNCGERVKKESNRQKMCKSCAEEQKKAKKAERQKQVRAKEKVS